MTESAPYDVLVAGGGPAGLAATAALASEGLRVACANPVQPPRWPNTYGIWGDELRAVDLEDAAHRSWPNPRVELDGRRSHRLDRTYARIDNSTMLQELVDRADRASGEVTWLEAAVAEAHPTDGGVRVETRDGRELEPTIAVDATGHDPVLADRADTGEPGFQTAYGIEARCDRPPCDQDEMVLMDFRTDHLDDVEAAEGPPTFLYVMELEPGHYLLEETTLVARPPVSFELLERRLRRRLDHRNLEVEVGSFERVKIPMGLPLPSPGPRTLPFGGAASMVHPATGYMVGRVLRAAPELAEAVASELASDDGDGRPRRAVQRGWSAVWPRTRRRARELLMFGQEALLEMNARQTADFFDAFFELEPEDWSDYMSGRISAGRTARIMWNVFESIGFDLRGTLARTAFSPGGRHLLRSVTR